jgi:hypothetical protein
MRLCKGHSDIQNVEDWFRLAAPKKGASQWKDGRSAKELAKAWCGRKNSTCPPEEFLHLITPLVNADQLADAIGWPEYKVPIDNLDGEPPNIDLAIVSDGLFGRTAICVEAKADESFGKYTLDTHDAAVHRIEQGEKTGALKRLLHLEENLLPEPSADLPGRAEIRYQLLTGTAATLALAKSHQASVAVFVVHEFSFVDHVDETKLRQNKIDLDRFISRLSRGSTTSIREGVLLGPLSPPSPHIDWGGVALYIGKVITGGGSPTAI